MIKNKRRCKTIVHTFVQLASLFPVAKKSEENYITFPSRENISSKFKVAHRKMRIVFYIGQKIYSGHIEMVLSFCATHFCYVF